MTQDNTKQRGMKGCPPQFNRETEIKCHDKRSVTMFRQNTAPGEVNRVFGCFKNSNTTHCNDSVFHPRGCYLLFQQI